MSLDLTGPEQLSRPIQSIDELVGWLRGAEKPAALWRVGVEHEKLGVLLPGPDGADGRRAEARGPGSSQAFQGVALPPIPYDGPRGIRALLAALHARAGGANGPGGAPVAQTIHEEDGNPIALIEPDGASVTLEPGGQLELSGAPARGLSAVDQEIERHLAAVARESVPLGMRWLAAGYRPFGAREAMPWMPKLRYGAMKRSLGPRGRLALDMMLMTATVQANLDWSDEADLADKVRVSTAVSPLVTALFANSPLVQGRDSGYLDFRYQVWRETDPARCGLLERMVQPGWGYRAYVEWALDVPLLFARRDGAYLDGKGQTFRSWLSTGKLGQEPFQPTLSSWNDHLTTLFPEIRVKRVLELRGADCVPPPYLLALPAVWMGILYDREARAAAGELTRRWTFPQRLEFQADVARRALGAQGPQGETALALARELVGIARAGLARWAEQSGSDERRFLDPLDEIASGGRTLAERALADFAAANRDPASLIHCWAIA
ncbi:MAG: glutamate--cysteine ligase [Myxococcales bacterium]